MTQKFPDIAALERLLDDLPKANLSHPAIVTISQVYGSQTGLSQNDAWWELLRIVMALPMVATDLPGRGAIAMAHEVIGAFNRLLDAEQLARPYNEYRVANSSDLTLARRGLVIFEDLTFNGELVNEQAKRLPEEIEKLREAIYSSNDLPDATRTLLSRQIDLLLSSFSQFRDGSVGPFKISAYSIYGRIKLELEPLATKDVGAFEKVLEHAKTVFDIVQVVVAAGGLSPTAALLAAPTVMKALPSPEKR